MRAKKIEKIDRFLYLIAEWKYVYSKDIFLRLRSKRFGYDIRFVRLLPADNIDRFFLRAIRLGQALKITLDKNSNIMFEAISFTTNDKNLIASALDKNPYRVINIVEDNNRWIVNAIRFSETPKDIPPGCGSKFYGEQIGKAIAAVECSHFRLDFVDFKNRKKETIRSIADVAELNVLTISRRNRAYIVEDIETINIRQVLIDILKKKLIRETRETETQLAKT